MRINKWKANGYFSFSPLFFGFFFCSYNAFAEESLSFDPSLLGFSDGANASHINLDYFSQRGGMLPGNYQVSIEVNGDTVASQSVEFKSFKKKPGKLYACLSAEQLGEWGVKIPIHDVSKSACREGGIISFIPKASERFDLNERRLSLSIPQSFMASGSWLKTPPSRWSNGIPAILLNYNLSGMNQTNQGQSYDSNFISINGGINLLGWRVRHDMTWQQSKGQNSSWNYLNTYAQHSFSSLQGGELTVGQTNTDGMLFDSIPFTGTQVASDDDMLVSNMSNFSPLVRGIATSPSVVTVRQNGSLIYQKNIETGPFELRDLPQASGNGDLQIEVRGADGKLQRFTQVASTVPMLLRAGRIRYSLAAGKYRHNSDVQGAHPVFIQGTLGWGLHSGTTVYGGTQLADNYTAAMAGVGQYFKILGALSFDITQAQARFSPQYNSLGTKTGQSYRFNYARGFEQTNTTLSITGYRYTTKGFYSFNDMQQNQQNNKDVYTQPAENIYHTRSRFVVSVSQSLGDYGAVSLSGSRDNYWQTSDAVQNWQTTYSTSMLGASINMSIGFNKAPKASSTDKTMALNMSFPLSNQLGGNTSANYMMNDSAGRVQNQVGISGSVLENNNLNYSITQGAGNQGQGNSGTANANYNGAYGSINGGYSYQQNSKQWNYGTTGGMLLTQQGVTFSQPLSFSSGNALVEAPGASALGVNNGSNVYTNWRGYAVVPNLIPYSQNQISLDVINLAADVELGSTDTQVVPTRGAVVLAHFDTLMGKKALITLTFHGQPVPFGAVAALQSADEMHSSIVSDAGQVYLGGLPEQGQLNVSWGQSSDAHCTAKYVLPPDAPAISEISAVCK